MPLIVKGPGTYKFIPASKVNPQMPMGKMMKASKVNPSGMPSPKKMKKSMKSNGSMAYA